VLGVTIGERVAVWTQPLVLPVLTLIMTLSATSITSRDFATIKAMPSRIAISLLLNYIVMTGIILLMAKWLINDSELWAGFVIIAAMPPAIALVPWSYVLGGDTLLSLMSMTVAYLLALVLTPILIVLFLGVESFNPIDLLLILGQLVVVPLVISRILLYTGWAKHLDRWRGTIVNWSFFVVLFTIVGLNRQAFLGEFDVLLRIAIIAITITFILGYAIELITKALHVEHATSISLILMGTMKNYGLASGILLTLFSERASIPTSICLTFAVLRMVWLGFHFRKSR